LKLFCWNSPGRRSGNPSASRPRKSAMLNTSENDQTRLLWSSHDWHVQPDCQRSTPDTAKAGRFGSRLNTARSGASSNLLRCVAASVHRTSCIAQAALGELSESTEV